MSDAPVSDIDLFSDEARLDPYPRYSALRQLGSVVYLPEYDVYALPRYQEARDVLGDWELYSSAEGVTMNRELDRELKGIMLFSDPPEHTAVRRVFGRPLRPERMRALEPRIGGSPAQEPGTGPARDQRSPAPGKPGPAIHPDRHFRPRPRRL